MTAKEKLIGFIKNITNKEAEQIISALQTEEVK